MVIEGTPIYIKSLTKRFGHVVALDGLSLDIKSSELFTLLGPSGCGKTTLLRTIAGLEIQDHGEIFFGTKRVSDLPPHKRGIALVFQNYALFPFLNVFDNIAYGLRVQRISKSEIRKRVEEAIKIVRLEGLELRRIDQLSGGQNQRIAVARAIVTEPKVLLMDEPLSNLDAKLRVQMRGDIKSLQNNLGITTVYVTHDQEEALSISDRIAVMSAGMILQIGVSEEIYNFPSSVFVADFIGNTNIVDVEFINEDEAFTVIRFGKYVLKTRDKIRGRHTSLKASMKFADIHPISDDTPCINSLTGIIREALYLGRGMKYRLEVDKGLFLYIETSGGNNLIHKAEGELLHVCIRPENIHVLQQEGQPDETL